MAVVKYCGNDCTICKNDCYINEIIPCIPQCKNLTYDGRIKVSECLKARCEEIKPIFDVIDLTNEEIIELYSEVAKFPYEI